MPDELKKGIPSFAKIRKNNPSGYILRKDISEKTGGLLNAGTMANFDSKGIGIKGRVKIGRNTAYPVNEVIKYLQSKTCPVCNGVIKD